MTKGEALIRETLCRSLHSKHKEKVTTMVRDDDWTCIQITSELNKASRAMELVEDVNKDQEAKDQEAQLISETSVDARKPSKGVMAYAAGKAQEGDKNECVPRAGNGGRFGRSGIDGNVSNKKH